MADIKVQAQQDAVPVELRQLLAGRKGEEVLLLIGENSVATQALVVWFPLLAALVLCYSAPFDQTGWGRINLLLILSIWLSIWLALALFTLAAGAGRHFYTLDLHQRRLTHLNSGASAVLQPGDSAADSLDELLEGWKLPVDAGTLGGLTVDQALAIPEWELPSLMQYFRGEQAGPLIAAGFIAGICGLPALLMSSSWGAAFTTLGALLAALVLAGVLKWALDSRQYRLLVGAVGRSAEV